MVSQPHKHTVPINVPRTFRRSVSSVFGPELLSWLRRSLSLSGGPVDPPIRVLTISCSHHLFTCFCRDFASHSTSCLNSRPRISPQHVTCQPCEKATRRSTYLKTGSPKHQETASSCFYCHGFLSQTHKSAQLSHQSCCGREGGQQSKSAAAACQHLPTSADAYGSYGSYGSYGQLTLQDAICRRSACLEMNEKSSWMPIPPMTPSTYCLPHELSSWICRKLRKQLRKVSSRHLSCISGSKCTEHSGFEPHLLDPEGVQDTVLRARVSPITKKQITWLRGSSDKPP